MPRPRYPSDEARVKVPPHVRVHLSARSHPHTAELFGDPTSRGVLVGLWLAARSGANGDEVVLDRAAVCWIAGKLQLRHALETVLGVCEAMHYRTALQCPHAERPLGARSERAGGALRARSERGGSAVRARPERAPSALSACGVCAGGVLLVEVRNFEESQGFHSAKRGAHSARSAASESETETETKTESLAAECTAEPGAADEGDARSRALASRPPPEPAIRCAELLRDTVRRRWPHARVPETVEAWARELAELDVHPLTLEQGMQWLCDPARDGDLYLPEVQSARAFCRKWDRIVAARQRQKRAEPTRPSPPLWKAAGGRAVGRGPEAAGAAGTGAPPVRIVEGAS